jgi:hypothetical protein
MRVHIRRFVVAAVLLVTSLPARAQTTAAADPSGHWQGALDAPLMQVPFEIDLAKNAGKLAGTVSIPEQKIKGLPLTKVAVDGTTVAFEARSDQPFTGVLSDDRSSITGTYLINGTSLPFTLTRSGDARIEPTPKSPAITGQLEGTWTATMLTQGMSFHLVMTLENHADGTAGGLIVNEDQGGLRLPVTIKQQGSSATIETIPVAGTLTATLNEAANELAGTFTQGQILAAVTFRRAK